MMADTDTIVVNVKIGLTEHERRRIRTGYLGRSGLATRKEIRQWVNAIIRAGIDGLPEPKTRKPVAAVAETTRVGPHALAQAAPDEAVCARCRRPKSDHGRMAFACPAGFRGTFTPMEAPR